LRLCLLLTSAGLWDLLPKQRSSPADVARGGAWSAPRLHIVRCHLRGEELRSKSWLPGRSLLPSSTLEHVSVIRSSRTFDRSAHQYFRSGSRDPPDLGANNPTRSGPCDPAAKPGFLSWGCPKIAPPSYRSRNPTPGDVLPGVAAGPCSAHRFLGRWRGARRLLRDGNANSHLRAAHVVFHHLDGLFLLDLATVCRSLPILGFTAFPPVAKQDSPLCTCCPSKPSLRRQRRPPRRISVTVGSRHRLDRFRPPRSPRTFPSRPFSLSAIPQRLPATSSSSRARTSRSCSIVGSVACPAVADRTHPVLPWACPTRPPTRPSDAFPRERGQAARKGHTNKLSALRQRPLRRAFPSV